MLTPTTYRLSRFLFASIRSTAKSTSSRWRIRRRVALPNCTLLTVWDEGVINADTIEEWGVEHMRTPYTYSKKKLYSERGWPKRCIFANFS